MKFHKKHLLFSAGMIVSSLFIMQNAEASTYTVKKDDGQTQVATISQEKKWEEIKSDFIFANQILLVSKRVETKKSTMSKSRMTKVVVSNQEVVSSTDKAITYKVVKGDTLTKISKAHDVRVEELKNWNNLQSDVIYVGQALKLFINPVAKDESSSIEVDVVDKIIEDETGEPVEQFTDKEIADVDIEIKKQLESEVANPFSPSDEGQAIYENVKKIANDLIGTPYVFGGNTPEGFDCSGFVRYVYANAGIDIERKSSKDYFMNDTTIVETPIVGDAVFFKNTYIPGISHMGIYIGNGEFIHAGNDGVETSKLEYEYWDSRFVAFKRFNEIK